MHHKKCKGLQRGQATVEFMLSMLILIPLMMMAFQAILYFYAWILAANAAQEAARSAAVHFADSGGSGKAVNALSLTDASITGTRLSSLFERTPDQAVQNVLRVRCRELFPFTSSEEDVTYKISLQDVPGFPQSKMVEVRVTIRVPTEPFRLVTNRDLYATASGRAFIEPWAGPELHLEHEIQNSNRD